MDTKPYQITIDCADPDRMARFWAEALGYLLEPPPAPHETWKAYWVSVGVPAEEFEGIEDDTFDSVVDPEGNGPRMWFQQVPEAKSLKNRLHFDLLVGGGRTVPIESRVTRVHAEADRLVQLGATVRKVMDNRDQGHYAIAMLDPEGNEFDIV